MNLFLYKEIIIIKIFIRLKIKKWFLKIIFRNTFNL